MNKKYLMSLRPNRLSVLGKLFLAVLLFIVVLPTVFRLMRPGFFPMYDDMQVIRLQQMDKCFKDAQIPCRWVPDLGYGYGYPLYQYYAPLPYYAMEIFVLFGLSYIDSVKLGLILSVFLSALFFYAFVRYFLSPTASLAATALYVFSPIRAADMYVRGAMGELWGMAALPLAFWGFENLIKRNSVKSLAIFALTLAVFLISHNLTVLMGIPLFMVWVILRLLMTKKEHKILLRHVVLGGVLGITVSGFFTIPLIFERNLVHLETLTQGYFNYLAHFINVKQLFFSLNWGYGPSVLGPNDEAFLGIGPIHAFFAAVGFLSVVALKTKRKLFLLPSVLLIVIFFIAAFLSHQKSSFIWQRLSFLSFLQFPWRFVLIAIFCASVLGGFAFQIISAGKAKVLFFLLIVFLITFYSGFFSPREWFSITDREKLSGELLERQLTASIYDYLPKSAKKAPDSRAPDSLIIKNGNLTVLEYQKGSNWFVYAVEGSKEGVYAVIPTYNFPEWEVFIDGNLVKITQEGELGLLGVQVPSGKHTITARLTRSTPRLLGDLLSILGISVASVILLKKEGRN